VPFKGTFDLTTAREICAKVFLSPRFEPRWAILTAPMQDNSNIRACAGVLAAQVGGD
jgi:hypothetical protein